MTPLDWSAWSGGFKVSQGPQVMLSADLLDDFDNHLWRTVDEQIAIGFRRHHYPWEYPDRAPFGDIDLFPRLTKTQQWANDWRNRITNARRALRGQWPEVDNW